MARRGRPRTIPLPGEPVRGSSSGVPVMALFDLLGRRWAMGILWVLCRIGPCTFRELQKHCETLSPSVLNTRLGELHAALLIERTGDGYCPTSMGRQLYELLVPLGRWSSKTWARKMRSCGPTAARPLMRA